MYLKSQEKKTFKSRQLGLSLKQHTHTVEIYLSFERYMLESGFSLLLFEQERFCRRRSCQA